MNWILLSLGCALSETIKDLTSKKAFKVLDEYSCAWAAAAFAAPWFMLLSYFFEDTYCDLNVLWIAPLTAGLHVLAFLLYFRALRSADLSLVLPLISFTPAFFLLTSPILIAEYASIGGACGIILIVIGSYILNLDAKKEGLLKPFEVLVKSTGARCMLGTAFIWSITGNFDRIGLSHCSPYLWFTLILTIMAVALGILMAMLSSVPAKELWQERRSLISIGFFHASSCFCYLAAIHLTLIAYVVSVKRLSVVFGVLWGLLAFKEEKLLQRLPASLCMFLGVVTIALSG